MSPAGPGGGDGAEVLDGAQDAEHPPSWVARVLVGCVQLYRTWISPRLLPSCRFDPTCSAYAVEALRARGALVGTGLALVRVVKCAPWHPGGWDPVPPRRRARPAGPDRSPGTRETEAPC